MITHTYARGAESHCYTRPRFLTVWPLALRAILCLMVAPSSPADIYAHETAVALITKYGASSIATEDATLALEHLRHALDESRRALDKELFHEVEHSVADRLVSLYNRANTHVSPEYRSALFAARLVDLCNSVAALTDRPIPRDNRIRDTAKACIADELAHLDSSLADITTPIDKTLQSVLATSVRPVLVDVQHDPLRPGYGQALSVDQRAHLRAVVENMLSQARALTADYAPSELPPLRIRDAASIANEARSAVSKLFRELESPSHAAIVAPAFEEVSSFGDAQLRKRVYQKLAEAERMESQAIIRRDNALEREMIRDNAPERVSQNTRRNSASDPHGGGIASVDSPRSPLWPTVLIAINIACVVILLIVARSVRKRA